MNYEIAIPSYKRHETIHKKTLSYLLGDCNVNPDKITVFVADEDEYKKYHAVQQVGCNLIIGLPTLRAQRNFIQGYYHDGENVLHIDDDVEGIYVKLSDKKFEKETDLNTICSQGFSLCRVAGTKLWGISAVLNPLFMRNNCSTDLKYIVGCFWGCINSHDLDLTVELEDKEDFERTIKYYKKFKSVVRLNNYAPKTKYYGEPGGMQVTRTEQRVTESAEYLLAKYPQFCRLNTGKKSTHTEIRLFNSLKSKK